jgi:hypothetical protein
LKTFSFKRTFETSEIGKNIDFTCLHLPPGQQAEAPVNLRVRRDPLEVRPRASLLQLIGELLTLVTIEETVLERSETGGSVAVWKVGN